MVNSNDENWQKVKGALIPTWLPLAAISYQTKLPIRTCEKILIKMYNDGTVKCSRVYIDGHNKVHLFKAIEYKQIMGMKIPIDTSELEYVKSESKTL